MAALPWMGLGLSTNLGPRERPDPHGIADLEPGLLDFVEYSAPLSLEEALREAPRLEAALAKRGELPLLFHPVHLNLYGPEFEADEALWALDDQARRVGSPWVGNDVAWWHGAGSPFPGYLYLPPPFDENGLADCTAHALHVQCALQVPLALENPTVQEGAGPLHVLDFMARLHARTGLPLILDLGHLLAHQLASGLPASAGLDDFPLDRVIEIHLGGGVVTERGARRFYADDHGQPVREELFELLAAILPRCRSLRAVTFEGDGQPEGAALTTLRRLRRLVPRGGPELRPWALPALPPVALGPASKPWEVFERLWAGMGEARDPEGRRAEVDYRLAVLAERLDRELPLCRLLFAPDREGLLAFCRSPEFRGAFGPSGRSVEQAFGTWARRSLRERPDEGLERTLAFESWARALASGGADDGTWREGTFPVDLSEFLFAARALRRHLAGRAAGAGLFESSGYAVLRQIARRAPTAPWRVAARRGPHGLEMTCEAWAA